MNTKKVVVTNQFRSTDMTDQKVSFIMALAKIINAKINKTA